MINCNVMETGSLKNTRRIWNYGQLMSHYQQLINKPNRVIPENNGIFSRYEHPLITAEHVPVNWRYDLNATSNPFGLERIGVNSAFNAGAIKWKDRYTLVVRLEGGDRKSYFAFADSPDGISKFKFLDKPLLLPQLNYPDINVYDMRLISLKMVLFTAFFVQKEKIRMLLWDTPLQH